MNVGGDVPIGDAFKLYWHFIRFENNGAVGIVLTVFLYIVTIFTSSVVIYFYFLRIHNNGRLMDVYHRLHAREDEFFIPYDLEISNVELSYISKKADQYRGEEGERRKTAVYDYIWEEEQVKFVLFAFVDMFWCVLCILLELYRLNGYKIFPRKPG